MYSRPKASGNKNYKNLPEFGRDPGLGGSVPDFLTSCGAANDGPAGVRISPDPRPPTRARASALTS